MKCYRKKVPIKVERKETKMTRKLEWEIVCFVPDHKSLDLLQTFFLSRGNCVICGTAFIMSVVQIQSFTNPQVPTLFEKHKPRPLFPSSQPPPEGGSKRLGVCANGAAGNGESIRHFDWPSYLESLNAEAAPVKCFHHVSIKWFF